MIRRWPIRIRLAAAFTVAMALILLGVGIATVTTTQSSLDESISGSLDYRLHDMQALTATGTAVLSGGSRDTATQIVTSTGQLLASSPEVAAQPLLTGPELASAARGELIADHAAAGQLTGPVRIAAAPTTNARIVVVAVSLADRDNAVDDLRSELLIAFPLVLLAAAIGAYLLAAAALRPVERMRARAATITAEDTQGRLPVPSARDEISRLGTTFNDLLTRLHGALARERRFVADASHELRTPLSLLTTELELALRRPRDARELTAAMESALEETERLSRLAQDLLLLARTDQAGPARRTDAVTEVRPVLAKVAARYRTALGDHDLIVDCAPGLAVRADADDLDRAVSNLIDNAHRHGEAPLVVKVCPASPDQAERTMVIEVCDHGPGFEPDFLPRAFDRFTRADAARTGGGTGLGLAIVAALARRNHGRVSAANRPDGATVTLTLPAAVPVPVS
jgi:signal transduction histidine kinase